MSTHDRLDLLGLPPDALSSALGTFLEEVGAPGYRLHQVERWIAGGEARDFGEMTDLPLELRAALGARFTIAEPEPARIERSSDGTAKHLWRLHDGELVESVLIPARDRLTLCISSQAGCAVGCTFCATGWSGFRRHLSAGEIVGQYRASKRWAEAEGLGPIRNIVFMGMGEPLANRAALFPALSALNHLYGIGARKITVSTVGVVPGIDALADRPEQFELAVSLHAPTPELRAELIPLERRWPLPELLAALRRFRSRGGRRITLEYTLIDGINDTPELAERLADIALDLGAFVNLIPFNPFPAVDYRTSPEEAIREFAAVLERRGVEAAVRTPRGRDIDAACGQLRASVTAPLAGGADPADPSRSRLARPIPPGGADSA